MKLRVISYFRELLQTLKDILFQLHEINKAVRQLRDDYSSMHRAALRRY